MPPKGFHRLKPDGEVRLRGVGIVQCEQVIKDDDGQVIELRCTLDPESRPGMAGANRKVKGTIHWVSAAACASPPRCACTTACSACPLRTTTSDGKSCVDHINPGSRKRVSPATWNPPPRSAAPEQRFQFERLGYFVADRLDHTRRRAGVQPQRDPARHLGKARPDDVACMLPLQIHLTLPPWVQRAWPTRPRATPATRQRSAWRSSCRGTTSQRHRRPVRRGRVRWRRPLIAVGVNRVVPQRCSVAHAEMMAYMLAQQRTAALPPERADGNPTAGHPGHVAQPCCQCYGATVWAGVDGLLIGARAEDVRR